MTNALRRLANNFNRTTEEASDNGFLPAGRFAYLLPSGMPSQVAAVLMCAGITVYSRLREYVVEPTQKVAIVGVGGLGHLAIQFAQALGNDIGMIELCPCGRIRLRMGRGVDEMGTGI